jgi:hypothetical protein
MASSINPLAVVQQIELEEDAEKFRIPFSMSISGTHLSNQFFEFFFIKLNFSGGNKRGKLPLLIVRFAIAKLKESEKLHPHNCPHFRGRLQILAKTKRWRRLQNQH